MSTSITFSLVGLAVGWLLRWAWSLGSSLPPCSFSLTETVGSKTVTTTYEGPVAGVSFAIEAHAKSVRGKVTP
jgi:hypothetical protein